MNDDERMFTIDRPTRAMKVTGQRIPSQVDRPKTVMNNRRNQRRRTPVEIQLMIRMTIKGIMSRQSNILDRFHLKEKRKTFSYQSYYKHFPATDSFQMRGILPPPPAICIQGPKAGWGTEAPLSEFIPPPLTEAETLAPSCHYL